MTFVLSAATRITVVKGATRSASKVSLVTVRAGRIVREKSPRTLVVHIGRATFLRSGRGERLYEQDRTYSTQEKTQTDCHAGHRHIVDRCILAGCETAGSRSRSGRSSEPCRPAWAHRRICLLSARRRIGMGRGYAQSPHDYGRQTLGRSRLTRR